jgi:hypothetical protein
MKEGQGTAVVPDGREFTLWSSDELTEIFLTQEWQVREFFHSMSKLRPNEYWSNFVLQGSGR